MKVVFEKEKKVDPIQLLEMKQELCSKYDLYVTRVIEKVTEIRVKLKFFEEYQTWRPYSAPYNTMIVKPLLQKSGLKFTYKNFRPVSNLPFISKIVEKAVLSQLFKHCEGNAPLPNFTIRVPKISLN